MTRTGIQSTAASAAARPIPPECGSGHASGRLAASDERLLVRRVQAGDRQAFTRLLDVYETRVYRLALRNTGTVADAEDVTQEIFVAVYRSIGNFRGDSALGTWIYRIAMNHCLEFRRKRRIETVPYDAELTLTSGDWKADPVQSADRRDTADRLEAALKRLSPLHRDVVVLHELQGLTYQEVAAALDVPVGT